MAFHRWKYFFFYWKWQTRENIGNWPKHDPFYLFCLSAIYFVDIFTRIWTIGSSGRLKQTFTFQISEIKITFQKHEGNILFNIFCNWLPNVTNASSFRKLITIARGIREGFKKVDLSMLGSESTKEINKHDLKMCFDPFKVILDQLFCSFGTPP